MTDTLGEMIQTVNKLKAEAAKVGIVMHPGTLPGVTHFLDHKVIRNEWVSVGCAYFFDLRPLEWTLAASLKHPEMEGAIQDLDVHVVKKPARLPDLTIGVC